MFRYYPYAQMGVTIEWYIKGISRRVWRLAVMYVPLQATRVLLTFIINTAPSGTSANQKYKPTFFFPFSCPFCLSHRSLLIIILIIITIIEIINKRLSTSDYQQEIINKRLSASDYQQEIINKRLSARDYQQDNSPHHHHYTCYKPITLIIAIITIFISSVMCLAIILIVFIITFYIVIIIILLLLIKTTTVLTLSL